MKTGLLSVLLALALAGCTRNGILELELDLPAQSGSARFAVIEALSDAAFDVPWPDDPAYPAIELASACTRPADPPSCGERMLDPECSAVVSIVGYDDEIEAPLSIRVRFCATETCDDGEPEHLVDVERAFYLGRYTQARVCLDEVPSTTSSESIGRCEVRCRDGLAAMHCRLDGTHFCE
jgi:hypothetical protein